jgi:hypothetical protein
LVAGILPAQGKEGPGEVIVAVHASRDLFHLYFLEAQIAPAPDGNLLFDPVEGKEEGRFVFGQREKPP